LSGKVGKGYPAFAEETIRNNLISLFFCRSRRPEVRALPHQFSNLGHFKVVLSGTAFRTAPTDWDIFPPGAGQDAIIGPA
jgi:hypothetical protein